MIFIGNFLFLLCILSVITGYIGAFVYVFYVLFHPVIASIVFIIIPILSYWAYDMGRDARLEKMVRKSNERYEKEQEAKRKEEEKYRNKHY